ncbi:hypothetical protein [Bacillus multifaciens]|uniref:hypothetical protein n=1 Tax=Bacillus multifaciens TaxID=3068506 RepID=UPI002741D872|nr:hypothetical protein [Bacillus sp. WLY-B-L8]MDP7981345.1 hypothetical protein [Bacillus sp. WLY-B-L8]
MLKNLFQFFIFVFVFFGAVSSSYAESVPVQVAFIRNHNLWIKINGKEKQVTKGEHIANPKWFQWAPSKNILAYIEGEGRFIVENKHLKLKDLPAFKQTTFTPRGYVDWDFTWNDNTLITISRAKEAKWSNDPKQRPKPSLYQINVANAQQLQITTPSKGYGDYYPYYITHKNQILWIRSNGEQADMWIANADGSQARKWIHNIDEAANYYEKRDWENVVSVKE